MERILVGYDGSEAAIRALDQACQLAQAYGAALAILTVADERMIRPDDGEVTMAADEGLARWTAEQAAVRAREQGVREVSTIISVESPGKALSQESAGFDLLVVGHRGHRPLEELFLGSTAKHVVDHAACSVLVVR